MKITRRKFIGGLAATGALTKFGFGAPKTPAKIDRFALVSRHNPVLTSSSRSRRFRSATANLPSHATRPACKPSPMLYKDAMPLCTMSQWGWHTTPMPDHLKGKEFKLTEYETYGRKVGYMTGKTGQEELYDYLRENPHRLHLGQIGFKAATNRTERKENIRYYRHRTEA